MRAFRLELGPLGASVFVDQAETCTGGHACLFNEFSTYTLVRLSVVGLLPSAADGGLFKGRHLCGVFDGCALLDFIVACPCLDFDLGFRCLLAVTMLKSSCVSR